MFVYPVQQALGACTSSERSCRAVQALGAWLAKHRCAGLGGTAQKNGAPAGLCRYWVCGLADIVQSCAVLEGRRLAEIINVCGSLALRAHPTEILLFIPREFGVAQPWWGKGAGPEDWRSHGVWSSGSAGL
jgi:hypothetical protein